MQLVGTGTGRQADLAYHLADFSRHARPETASSRRIAVRHAKHGGSWPAGHEHVASRSTWRHLQDLCRACYTACARAHTHKVSVHSNISLHHTLPSNFIPTACSVLLLPAAQPRSTTTAGTETLGTLNKGKPSAKSSLANRLEWQQYMGGTKSSKAEAGKKVEPDLLTWPYADLQTGSELSGRPAFTARCQVSCVGPSPAFA